MKCSVKIIAFLLVSSFLVSSCSKDEDNALLENFSSLTLSPNSHWNGSDNSGSFKAGVITFPNTYVTSWSSWNGFAYSNKHDVKTSGHGNQYSSYAIKDTAITNSNIFVVAYPYYNTNTIEFDQEVNAVRMKVTNTTFAALSMKNGDLYSKKFGGTSGTDKDWFKLSVIGLNAFNLPTDTVDFYLADFRFDNSSQDFIVNDWKSVNLSPLGKIKKMKFELSSTDNGDWGMNTPGYFCLDDIEYHPVAK